MMRMTTAIGIAIFICAGARILAAEPVQPNSRVVAVADPLLDANAWELNRPLNAARESFLQFDTKAAADKIRQGAQVLRSEAGNAAMETKVTLIESADKLESLAKRVELRSVERVEELDRMFAYAFSAAAQHHYVQGNLHWRSNEPKLAGYRLKAAVDHLEATATSASHRLSSATHETIRESRAVSSKLIRGAGYATDEVASAFQNLGKEIETLGEKVAPVAANKRDGSVK